MTAVVDGPPFFKLSSKCIMLVRGREKNGWRFQQELKAIENLCECASGEGKRRVSLKGLDHVRASHRYGG